MPEFNISIEKAQKVFDEIAEQQMPYACARTLTHVAMKIADKACVLANQRFNVKHRYYLQNATHGKVGKMPSLARAFHSTAADKHDGLERMQSSVAVSHWGIADLVDGKMDTRGTIGKAKYRWIPLKGRKPGYGVKNAYPGQGNKSRGNFFMKSKKGNHLLVTRAGKSGKLTPMFLRRKTQNMRPVMDLQQISNYLYPKYWGEFFEKDLDYAIRTARWP